MTRLFGTHVIFPSYFSVVRVVAVGREVVVREIPAVSARPACSRTVLRDRADAVRRDVVAGVESRIGRRRDAAIRERERHPARAVRRASARIVNAPCSVPAKLPVAHRHRRKIAKPVRAGVRQRVAGRRALARALDAGEIEQLVADDGTAGRAADRRARCRCPSGRRPAGSNSSPSSCSLCACSNSDPASCVRAALHLHVHRRAAGHPLIGVEAVGDDAHRLDRFEAGAVGLNLLEELVDLR